MSVLVYTEVSRNKIRKSSLEAVNYAAHIANQLSTTVSAVTASGGDASICEELGKAGANKVLTISDEKLNDGNSAAWAMALDQVALADGASVVIFSHDIMSKAIAPRLAVRMKAGIVAGAVEYPSIADGKFTVRKNAFSGKATTVYVIHSEKKIITLLPNSYPVQLNGGTTEVAAIAIDLSSIAIKVTVKELKKRDTSKISLPEAELVVSAGRGMKDPKNWGIVEDLASAIGAATACSRPISDMDWRPHHEHVGQTGITVRPNLYIAIGISGAIQHLAGVSGSKTIVVINTDKEAPFFKSADYGIIGDAFEVVPRLTEAIKKFKSSHQ